MANKLYSIQPIATMFGIFTSLYNECFGSPAYNICILGVQETGKTVLLNTIKHINQNREQGDAIKIVKAQIQHRYKPTVGLNVTKYKNGKDKFMIWDLGGKSSIRKIWQNYYSECHGVIFLFNEQIKEGIDTLKNVCQHQEMIKIPILIIASTLPIKEQLDSLLNKEEWISDRKCMVYVMPIHEYAVKRQTIKEVLHWLYRNINQLHEQIKE